MLSRPTLKFYTIIFNIVVYVSVEDPHHVDADPDPVFHFQADPDPDLDPIFHSVVDSDSNPDLNFQFDADPDPTTHLFFTDLDPPMLQNDPLKIS
jgi:hypothetical protein